MSAALRGSCLEPNKNIPSQAEKGQEEPNLNGSLQPVFALASVRFFRADSAIPGEGAFTPTGRYVQ